MSGSKMIAALSILALAALAAEPALAAAPQHGGGEASLQVPDLGQVTFQGMNGRDLLMTGLLVCALGLLFGLVIYTQLKRLPVHAAMREISELIYETCKTYLITQGKFLLVLEAFIGIIIVLYFGVLLRFEAVKVAIILAFSLIGIGGLPIRGGLFLMLCILLFIPGDYSGPCLIGFAIGESLGAAALRIAGGI